MRKLIVVIGVLAVIAALAMIPDRMDKCLEKFSQATCEQALYP